MQLILPFHLDVEYGLGQFVISSCNLEAYKIITADYWPFLNRVLILGEEACGKTHLCNIWAAKQQAIFIDQNFNFSIKSSLILDGIDENTNEEFIFHVINYSTDNNLKLLMTARTHFNFKLLDLRSRIVSTPHYSIKMPDQELIKYIMLKHFSDLQIPVSFKVIEYAANFLPKDYRAIKNFICHIDNLALSLKREITLPLIKQYFLLDERYPELQ